MVYSDYSSTCTLMDPSLRMTRQQPLAPHRQSKRTIQGNSKLQTSRETVKIGNIIADTNALNLIYLKICRTTCHCHETKRCKSICLDVYIWNQIQISSKILTCCNKTFFVSSKQSIFRMRWLDFFFIYFQLRFKKTNVNTWIHVYTYLYICSHSEVGYIFQNKINMLQKHQNGTVRVILLMLVFVF